MKLNNYTREELIDAILNSKIKFEKKNVMKYLTREELIKEIAFQPEALINKVQEELIKGESNE